MQNPARDNGSFLSLILEFLSAGLAKFPSSMIR